MCVCVCVSSFHLRRSDFASLWLGNFEWYGIRPNFAINANKHTQASVASRSPVGGDVWPRPWSRSFVELIATNTHTHMIQSQIFSDSSSYLRSNQHNAFARINTHKTHISVYLNLKPISITHAHRQPTIHVGYVYLARAPRTI